MILSIFSVCLIVNPTLQLHLVGAVEERSLLNRGLLVQGYSRFVVCGLIYVCILGSKQFFGVAHDPGYCYFIVICHDTLKLILIVICQSILFNLALFHEGANQF